MQCQIKKRKNTMKAQDIISKARKELVDFIIFEMKMIFMYIYKGEEPCAGCDWVIEAGDLNIGRCRKVTLMKIGN